MRPVHVLDTYWTDGYIVEFTDLKDGITTYSCDPSLLPLEVGLDMIPNQVYGINVQVHGEFTVLVDDEYVVKEVVYVPCDTMA